MKGGETVLLKGYGQADREGGVPMRPDSVFNLGSITKPFTAAAILRLQELGKLKTSDPVSRFFDGVPEDKAGITLEHLLTHSSGLESDFGPTDYEPTTREEYVRRALASKLLFPPGQGYEYANAGYSLLAAVVEQDERAGLRDGARRAGAEARRHDGDRLQGPALGHGAHRPRLPRRRGLGHDPRPHRGARARRSGRCGATAASTRRSPTWCAGTRRCGPTPSSPRPPARATFARAWRRARGPGRTTPSAGRSRRRRTARSCSTTAATAIYVAELLRFVDEGVMIFLASTVAELKATPVVPALTAIVFGEPYDLPPAVVTLSPEACAPARGDTARRRARRWRCGPSRAGSR